MGENKKCSSCGNTIPAEAVFCPNCGVRQTDGGQAHSTENTGASIDERIAQETAKAQPVPEKPSQAPNAAPVQQPASSKPAAPVQQNVNATPAPLQMQRSQQGYPQSQQQYPQPQQPAQYYQQYGPAQPAQTPAKPKKKFPWVFTIVWAIMLVFVGIWAYCYMDPNYQVPEVTTDTVRVVTFVVSIILLIYTLNLRLMTKKLKAVPTILLVIFLLASFFMYVSFEMVEGDWLHDLFSPVTNAIFQIE